MEKGLCATGVAPCLLVAVPSTVPTRKGVVEAPWSCADAEALIGWGEAEGALWSGESSPQ